MTLSNLIRWGGLAAMVGGALFIIADLATAVFAFGQGSAGGLLFRSIVSGSAGVLLALGLVSLYARQAGATGNLGLLGFLAAFIGLWFGQQNIVWAALLANLGWILFGAASLGARVYPRIAVILLIIGAVLAGVVNLLLAIIQAGGAPAVYIAGVGAIADIVFNVGVA